MAEMTKMNQQDKAQAFEQEVARALNAQWVERPAYTSAPDVVGVPGFPSLIVECKLRKTHSVHRWMKETRERYGGIPCVVMGEHDSDESYAAVPLTLLSALLRMSRDVVFPHEVT